MTLTTGMAGSVQAHHQAAQGVADQQVGRRDASGLEQLVELVGESLHVSLDRHRDAVLWKLEGLDDADLRRAMTPSGTNLLGLVKHLAAVEYGRCNDPLLGPDQPAQRGEED